LNFWSAAIYRRFFILFGFSRIEKKENEKAAINRALQNYPHWSSHP